MHGCAFTSGNEKAGPHGFSPTYILARILHLKYSHIINHDVERIRLLFERPLRDPYLTCLRITIIIIITTSRSYTFYILLAILEPLLTLRIPERDTTICANSARQRDHSLLGSERTRSLSHMTACS